MEAITLVALVTLMKKVVDTFKYVTNRNINALVTQVVTWATGVLLVWIATAADITADLAIFGQTFGDLNGGSIILGGMIFSSAASVVYDLQASNDNADTAATPPLLPRSSHHNNHPTS